MDDLISNITNKFYLKDEVKVMLKKHNHEENFKGIALHYEGLAFKTLTPIPDKSAIGFDCLILMQENLFRSKMLMRSYFRINPRILDNNSLILSFPQFFIL